RLAGLPLSGNPDEESACRALGALPGLPTARVWLRGHHRIGFGARAAWAFRRHLLNRRPKHVARIVQVPTNLTALASSASAAHHRERGFGPSAIIGRTLGV